MRDEPGKLTVETVFAANESEVILHGCADTTPKVSARSGKAGEVKYDAATKYFTVKINPDPSKAPDKSEADPVPPRDRGFDHALIGNSKIQAPSSREAPNFKHQTSRKAWA